MHALLESIFRPSKLPVSVEVFEEGPIGTPIIALDEITDNRFLLESLFDDFASLTDLDLSRLGTFGFFTRLCDSQTPIAWLVENMHEFEEWAPIGDWLVAEKLPSDFRRVFTEQIIRLDGLEEHVAQLSQIRWERLRGWVAGHD